jgi:HAD superfamily hydrolase (TIGR01490 family)
MARAAAFFDLDKTLMAGSSGMVWAQVAYEAGQIPRRMILRWALDHLRYRLRGASDELTQEVLRQARELLRGTSERELRRMGPAVMAGVLPRIYPQMLEEVHAHQDEGRPTFIVSAASNDLVELLAVVLGMDGGVGTRYELDENGRYTGELDGPFVYGEGKVEAMRRYAAEHDIDLSASWAYSDSASDLPMLRTVGNPVVVNPDPALLEVARAEGWRVMRFDKLGRRLAILGGALVAAALGGAARALLRRRAPQRRLRAVRIGAR